MKKLDEREVLAVDFGTVNTYITKCSAFECLPRGIHFSSNRTGLSTAVLEREGKKPLVGDVAVEEYADATDAERKKYKFYSQFKPEILTSEKARELAQTYLSTVIENARANRIELEPLEMQVILGVPCEKESENTLVTGENSMVAGENSLVADSSVAGENTLFSEVLTDVAEKAGFGKVRLVEEPVGALLYHVAMGAISAVDAQKGILVVDFGGGTCDFAAMDGGRIVRAWGDTALGGRLFDDLFFQWFLDENPKMLEALRKDGREIFTLLEDCKEIKEKFSEIISLERDASLRKTISNYGHLDNLNVKNFEKRARNYKKSETLKKYFKDLGTDLECTGGREDAKSSEITKTRAGADDKIDLLGWFERALVEGFEQGNIGDAVSHHPAFEDIQYVILAGGSSLWYFVADIIKKYIPSAKIIRSDRPYATISEGLSLIPALKKKNKAVQEVLKKELPDFLDGASSSAGTLSSVGLKKKMEALIEKYLERIVNVVIAELFEKEVVPLIIEFREKGGKIEELKQNIQEMFTEQEDKIRGLTDGLLQELGDDLEFEMRHDISEWFNRHKICLSDDQLFKNTLGFTVKSESFSTFDSLFTLINNLLAGIAGFVLVIIFSQPVTMIIGFVAAFAAVLFGADRLEKVIEKRVELPAAVTKMLFNDRKLVSMKKQVMREINRELKKKNREFLATAEGQVRECVEREIEGVNEINTV